jgi:hypothetical protein
MFSYYMYSLLQMLIICFYMLGQILQSLTLIKPKMQGNYGQREYIPLVDISVVSEKSCINN